MENKNQKIQPQHFASVYDYLEALGVLEFGDHQDIQEAKSFYWSSYRKRRKEDFDKKNKSISISFKLDDYFRLKKDAESFKMPLSKYLKEQIFNKGTNTSEIELLLLDLIVELEDEEISQDLIVKRLEILLQKLQA
ncbi:MAG: hypothetical protein N4A45_07830 [Flavobacteriales bacterium]|jgi:predicted DNA binding CopG/RHH family protein|nr:hypothetical protein [Flavobacteriales bacterium]